MMRRNISSWMFRKANIPSIDPAIDREISAVSKFSSVIDKNRGYAAADMPAIHREDPRQNLLRKSNDLRKGASISVPSNEGRGRVRPLLMTANGGLRSVSLEARSVRIGSARCRWRDRGAEVFAQQQFGYRDRPCRRVARVEGGGGRYVFGDGMIWSPYARVSWVYEFERERSISAAFIALPGSAFTVDGPRAAADAARVDLGSQFAITHNVALFGSFDGEFSDRSRMLTGKAGLKANW